MNQHEKDHESLVKIAGFLHDEGMSPLAIWLEEFADGYLWEKS